MKRSSAIGALILSMASLKGVRGEDKSTASPAEAKAIQEILPIHKAQLLSYMRLLDVPLGLVLNFNVERVTDGIARVILAGAGR